ncbi:hypothetical protein WB401_07625 [Streptomyces brasiliscabiei]|uniref:Uncharacterized protein n=1 Tax=Streptomyces brasiliscabiei TaxID=2736302 RepID=A0ABU8G3I8_9ACTN
MEVATPADPERAGGYTFGTPTRYGAPAAQLHQFVGSAGSVWQAGKVADDLLVRQTNRTLVPAGTLMPAERP